MARTLEIFAQGANTKTRFSSAIRGYHVHMNKWKPEMGDRVFVMPEPANKKDKFACVVKDENLKCIGHIPYEIAAPCFKFLQEGKISGIVTGKRRKNRDSPTGGLEIPCLFMCEGQKNCIDELKNGFKKKRKPPVTWN